MNSFTQNAIKRELKGNKPLILDNPEKIYISGTDDVDLFVVKIKNLEIQSEKRHFLRLNKGELIPGFKKRDDDLFVIATGKTGSFIYEKDFKSLTKELLDNKKLTELIENWIGSASKTISKKLPPKDTINIVNKENILPSKTFVSVKSSDRLKWIKPLDGEVFFLSEDILSLNSYVHEFPLHEKGWVFSQTESKIQAEDSCDYFLKDKNLEGFNKFNDFILSIISEKIKKDREKEFSRYFEVIENDAERTSNAIFQLGGALASSGKVSHKKSEFSSPLFEACRIVGRESEIKVIEPTKESLINSDPLNALSSVSGFRTRKVALSGEWWKSDSGPLLGFITDEETQKERPAAFIIKKKGYQVFDPETKESFLVNKKTNETLGMFAYSFYRPLPTKPLKAIAIYRFGTSGSGKDKIMITIMATIVALIGLLTPVATGVIFDRYIPQADKFGLLFIGGILLSCALSKALFEITKAVATLRITGKAENNIQSGVMDRLLSLPVSFFRNYNAGDLAERTLGINAIRDILSGVTLNAIMGGCFSIFNLALLFYYSSELAWVALAITAFSMGILSIAGFYQLGFQRKIQKAHGKLSGIVFQFISGISKLRVSGTEERAFANWADSFSQIRKFTFKARNLSSWFISFNSVIPVISMFIIFFWIIYYSLDQKISVGSIVAFYSALTQFQSAMIQMFTAFLSSMQIIPLYERSKPIFEAIPEKDEAKASPGELAGEIEINSINFRYAEDSPLVLEDISMKIPPGEFVAISGSSGSGKSTLLRLLLGFETPESGTIYYDGHDISGIDITAVRRQFGVVLQNGTLMPGDIFSNIIGSLNLTLDDAWKAAEMAGLDKDIKEMPMGMNTIISPGAPTLSGGQRQRLLIARAIVHKPRIIYFDEATSALDNQTQKQVSESLENLNATRVIIAHRLSTIKNADRIFVIDKGRIVQQGKFEELNSSEGIFKELVKRQTA